MTALNIFLILIAGLSIVTFIVWGIDKAAAINGTWRVPERTLLRMAFFGGAIGAGLGMLAFRHKTQKPLFQVTIPIALILQAVLFGLLLKIH